VEDFDWTRDPVDVLPFLPLKAEEELAVLKADRTLEVKFRELSHNGHILPVSKGRVLFEVRDGCWDLITIFDTVFV
jgi:hypothetical protein